jgi:hypothetical protein
MLGPRPQKGGPRHSHGKSFHSRRFPASWTRKDPRPQGSRVQTTAERARAAQDGSGSSWQSIAGALPAHALPPRDPSWSALSRPSTTQLPVVYSAVMRSRSSSSPWSRRCRMWAIRWYRGLRTPRWSAQWPGRPRPAPWHCAGRPRLWRSRTRWPPARSSPGSCGCRRRLPWRSRRGSRGAVSATISTSSRICYFALVDPTLNARSSTSSRGAARAQQEARAMSSMCTRACRRS